jgi:hypothetical protein
MHIDKKQKNSLALLAFLHTIRYIYSIAAHNTGHLQHCWPAHNTVHLQHCCTQYSTFTALLVLLHTIRYIYSTNPALYKVHLITVHS